MKFALAGNPNCGKTTLFNALTGSTAHVGNWPGVTVDRRTGLYKKLPERVEIVDLPGIYSLSPYSPEETVSRDFLLSGEPDVIVNIVDATNLERNLYLTTQLLETDIPVVVALNMADAVEREGGRLHPEKLAEALGVPVVAISALKNKNLDAVMKAAWEAASRPRAGTCVLEDTPYRPLYERALRLYREAGKDNPVFRTVKALEGDELEQKASPELFERVAGLKKEGMPANDFGDDFEGIMADQRYTYISARLSGAVTKKEGGEKLSGSDRADRVLTHRIWGIPIFLVIMFAVFHCTFSENFLFLSWAFPAAGEEEAAVELYDGSGALIEALYDADGNRLETFLVDGAPIETFYDASGRAYEGFFDADGNPVEPVIGEDGSLSGAERIFGSEMEALLAGISWHTFFGFEEGVNSPGVILFNTMDVLTSLVNAALVDAMPAGTWYTSLVVDGLWAGLASVLSFIPQILVLFLFLSILEDSGYMARVAFIMDRAFRRFGLSGKAFLPLLMCFGCAVPGIMATRTLENEKERRMTILLAPFFSCGAKLPIWAAFGAILFAGSHSDLIVYSMYLLGIVVAVLSAILLRKTALRGETPPFIMELPAYHRPQFKNTMIHLWEKLKHYIVRAATIIAGAVVVIWFLTNFGFAFWQGMVDQSESIIGVISQWFAWLFVPLGFGMGENGWMFVVAAFTGLIAKEMVVATMGTFVGMDDALDQDPGSLTSTALGSLVAGMAGGVPAALAFMAFNLLSVPCMAAVGAASGEFGSRRKLWFAIGYWMATAYVVSALIFWIGTYWWIGVILAALLILAAVIWAVVRRRKKAAA